MKQILLITLALAHAIATPLAAQTVTLPVRSSNFTAGQQMEARGDSGAAIRFVISDRGRVPFVQSDVSQDAQRALQAPDPQKPYFKVREALPIPAAYTSTEQGRLVGLDEGVYTHAHSPGFEILPNGDALAIYFSTPKGKSENDTACTFIQARLRFGAEEWDMPELFMNTIGANDQTRTASCKTTTSRVAQDLLVICKKKETGPDVFRLGPVFLWG